MSFGKMLSCYLCCIKGRNANPYVSIRNIVADRSNRAMTSLHLWKYDISATTRGMLTFAKQTDRSMSRYASQETQIGGSGHDEMCLSLKRFQAPVLLLPPPSPLPPLFLVPVPEM
nr:hypothetical protein CFP56_09313 [Quercus suber]